MTPESPKTIFRRLGHAKKLADLSSDDEFIHSLDSAMLQMQWEYGVSMDTNEAMIKAVRLEGARIFRNILLTLADPEPKTKYVPKDSVPFPEE